MISRMIQDLPQSSCGLPLCGGVESGLYTEDTGESRPSGARSPTVLETTETTFFIDSAVIGKFETKNAA